MQQLSIFDVFQDFEKEEKINEILQRQLITVHGKEVDRTLIVAVYVPIGCLAEPSVATLEDGEYKHYRFKHGHLYDDTLYGCNWQPSKYNNVWTWL